MVNYYESKRIIELQNQITMLIQEKHYLFNKLQRVRDWLNYAANSEGGIVAEIDNLIDTPIGDLNE